ncbi:M23 family metallopeptidase [Mariprofundus sp. EBB-1]|nr:M23 family metallopeptidase [Mariprofundus sp. EBB-1]
MVNDCCCSSCCRWICFIVVVIARLCSLIILLALGACVTTPVPGYKHTYKQTPKHTYQKSSRQKKAVIRYVRPHDTLYSIGNMFDVDYKLIAKRNHIPYPYNVYVGQRLYINRTAPKTDDPTAVKIRRLAFTKKSTSKKHARKQVKKKVTTHKKVAHHKKKAHSYSGKLRWPIKPVVTSKFGRRGSRMHDGIDIGAKEGTPIHAAAGGEVVYSDSRLSGYGKLIIIRHGKNLFTAYGHNQRNLVKKGAKVKAGDVIARVGHTGRATGPHLHFEVRQGSTPVNPIAYLPRR